MGEVQWVQTPPPPPKFSDFSLKSEGKEIERKRKEGCWGGGGLPLNIFLGLRNFREGLRNFREGLRNFRGGLRNYRGGGCEIFGGGVRNFRDG